MAVAIRWDIDRMSELAAALDAKAGRIRRLRDLALGALDRGNSLCDPRAMPIAALWADHGAVNLRERAKLLGAAERELLWSLDQVDVRASDRRRMPAMQARSIDVVSVHLDVAHEAAAATVPGSIAAARAEARIATLTFELAVATRAASLMALTPPDPRNLATLDKLIDFLSYEIAKSAPHPPAEWARVAEATEAIRRHLDESWFGDVSRGELETISEILESLSGAELDLVIASLSDAELYRWFRELDGIRGGNLDLTEEMDMFAMVAGKAGAATLIRLAGAERGAKFAEIAAAVQRYSPREVAMEFVEIAAASAATSDDSLGAALAGLVALGEREREIVLASLHSNGLLVDLDVATKAFLSRHTRERDDPVVVEFFEGLLEALGGTVKTIVDLSIGGLVDSHRFRESWSQLAKVIVMIPTDPIQFAAVVVDLDTFAANPSRWLGGASADVLTLGVGRLARLGRLGTLAKSVADWIKKFGRGVVARRGNLELQRGHVIAAIERLHDAADAAAARRVINDALLVESYSDELGDLVSSLADLDSAES